MVRRPAGAPIRGCRRAFSGASTTCSRFAARTSIRARSTPPSTQLAGYGGEHRIVITRDGAMDELLIRLEAAPDVHAAGERRAAGARRCRRAEASAHAGACARRSRSSRPERFPAPTSRRGASSTTARCFASSMRAFRSARDGSRCRRSISCRACSPAKHARSRGSRRAPRRRTTKGRPALDAIFRHAGRAHVVGITGVPGSGKSTLVAKLAAADTAHRTAAWASSRSTRRHRSRAARFSATASG